MKGIPRLFSLNDFYRQYETEKQPLRIDDRSYVFLVPGGIDRFIDPEQPLRNFPLWAKIWPAGMVLADHLSRTAPEATGRILEIGSGIGLAGIVAACRGHRVTLTDFDEHALNFARANALVNGCQRLEVACLDWNRPAFEDRFDTIIGSEVIFREADVAPLDGLFRRYLAPGGVILLAAEMRKPLADFFRKMEPSYSLSIRKRVLKGPEGDCRVLLIRLMAKPGV
jgi:2-polyprenyl-3-methyl-5-hydroxy-6-metoxy-1,4-benzoquinol methylase